MKRKVLSCPECSLVWLEPKETNLEEFYRQEYRQLHSPVIGKELGPAEIFDIYRPLMDYRLDSVVPHVNPSMRVLDLGCATGYFLDALEPFVGERVGLEFNESHAAYARGRLGIEIDTRPIEESGCAAGSFDMIFMFHVLEHVPDPIGLLSGLVKYLSPQGKVYIEVPNVWDALLSTYRVPEYADFYYREPHLFYFSPKTLKTVTECAGYSGRIDMIQRYGLANHLHWVTAASPQGDVKAAMGVPELTSSNINSNSAFEDELQAWLRNADQHYRNLLRRHERAEAMSFIGSVHATT